MSDKLKEIEKSIDRIEERCENLLRILQELKVKYDENVRILEEKARKISSHKRKWIEIE